MLCAESAAKSACEALVISSTRTHWKESDAMAGMGVRDRSRLLQLAERLPGDEIPAATRFLEFLTSRRDPYLLYLMSVPEEEQELSAEGQRLLDEGWEDIRAGRLTGSDEARQELGL